VNANNPTVAVHVTDRELAYIVAKLGYFTPAGLSDKLTAAQKDMREARRAKNRAHKLARRAKAAARVATS
jgi:hypothetical protein